MNQETKKAQAKPVLSAESFQRLLLAAYLLQVDKDPIGAGHTNPFTAGAIVQKRTPSLPAGQPGLLASRSVVPFTSPSDSDGFAERIYPPCVSAAPWLALNVTGVSIANETGEGQHADASHAVLPGNNGPKQSPSCSGGLMPLFGPIVPHAMNIFASRAMFLRTVEALAIGTIFLALVGLSIRGPGRTSLLSEMSEQRNFSQPVGPTAKLLVSSQQPVVTRNSRQPPDGGETDIVAKDIVIRYQKSAVNLPGQAAKKPAMLAAETVIQYGPDVSVWAGNPTKRNGLIRLGR